MEKDLRRQEDKNPRRKEEMLSENAIRTRLEVIADMLEMKKAEDDAEHEKRMKEYRSTSVMTKYQMVFTKIEVYTARLINMFAAKECNMKLVSFLRLKQLDKFEHRSDDVFVRMVMYKMINGFKALEAVSQKLKTRMIVKGFIFLKFSNLQQPKNKTIFNNSATAKLNLLRVFNKTESKKIITEHFDRCITESAIEPRKSQKSRDKRNSTVSLLAGLKN